MGDSTKKNEQEGVGVVRLRGQQLSSAYFLCSTFRAIDS